MKKIFEVFRHYKEQAKVNFEVIANFADIFITC